jgi:tetratricopeptide (TPR) repeat protein
MQQSLAPTPSAKSIIDHPLADIPAGTVLSVPPNAAQSPRSSLATTPAAADISRAGLALTQKQTAPPVQTMVAPSHYISMNLDEMADSFLSVASPRTAKGLQPLLQPEPLPTDLSDLERLKCFVKRRSWGDASLLTEKLLRGQSSHYAPIYNALITNSFDQKLPILDSQQEEMVQIMMIQCEAWIKLSRYAEIGLEIERWSFCHHNDNTAPCWIPWQLHIMAASSLLYTSDDPSGKQAIDALWKIRQDIPVDDSISQLQVEHALSNSFIRLKDWRMALSCQERMLDLLPSACRQQVQQSAETTNPLTEKAAAALQGAYRCEILSQQGRVFLQLGATNEARQIFDMVRDTATHGSVTDETMQVMRHSIPFVPAQISLNEGLLKFSEGQYNDALACFRHCVGLISQRVEMKSAISPSNSSDMKALIAIPTGAAPEDALCSEAINNMSLCALYTCNLHEAILLMESLIREDPTKFLTERVCLNLCILYELSNETSMAAKKKKVLQLIAKRFMLHDIGPSSLRL